MNDRKSANLRWSEGTENPERHGKPLMKNNGKR